MISTLGRGAASGLAGALVWIGVSVLVTGTADPRRAALASLAPGTVVGVATAATALR
jgi:hypothetical protein